jgi:hypothetical protein
MNDSFNDDDSSDFNSLNLCANANFIFDRWDEYLRIDSDEDQWVSIELSSFNDLFDDYVDCFVVENFNVNENSMYVNFSIAAFHSSS